MIAVAVMVTVAMAVQDTLDTARLVLVGAGRWVLAAVLDGAADVARQLSIGAGGAELVLHRLSLAAGLIVAGTLAGSVAGGGAGFHLGRRLRAAADQSQEEHP